MITEWIACQIGAREHYAVPRMLARRGRLKALVTDAWVAPGSPLARMPGGAGRRIRERYHPQLAAATVAAATMPLLAHEIGSRAGGGGWPAIMARNDWFQAQARQMLRSRRLLAEGAGGPPVVFAYSYAARQVLAEARQAGCRTVLGQIDGGPQDARLIGELIERSPPGTPPWIPPPTEYWGFWRTECLLADRIVVNSEWARDCLLASGAPRDKLRIIPLAYEADETAPPQRNFPARFDAARPLQVLFLGSASVRKGIAAFVGAAAAMVGAPVRFTVVGPVEGTWPQDLPNLAWAGPAPRGAVGGHYAAADVFVLPTHSDGFAITQVEAMAAGLPVIASRNCGRVVTDGRDGLLLDMVSAEEIARALTRLLAAPAELAAMSAEAVSTARRYTLDRVALEWEKLGEELSERRGG